MTPIKSLNNTTPVLMITYNRLNYTKQALQSLFDADDVLPIIIDNGSTDGTVDWLKQLIHQDPTHRPFIFFNHSNKGIAHAMNIFLEATMNYDVVGKVDNDTIVPRDFVRKLKAALKFCHIVQAKHHIIPATHPDGWNGFVKGMKFKNGLYYNHYVGGSGILFWRSRVDRVPTTTWKLGGWREFQKQRPELTKAFCPDIEIRLLDEHGYDDYPAYYVETGRLTNQKAP